VLTLVILRVVDAQAVHDDPTCAKTTVCSRGQGA